MKILVDANPSPRVAAELREGGYDTAHVRDHGLLGASDEEIAKFACERLRDPVGGQRFRDDARLQRPYGAIV
jgi:hypothetical protein